MKTIFVTALLALTVSCSSTMTKVNQASSEVGYGTSAIENASSTVDRAVAAEQRIKHVWTKK